MPILFTLPYSSKAWRDTQCMCFECLLPNFLFCKQLHLQAVMLIETVYILLPMERYGVGIQSPSADPKSAIPVTTTMATIIVNVY